MKTVRLKTLKVENFKGLSYLSIQFNDDDETNIVGANGTGKTSLYDAYLWLILGIDSAGRASFSVQPLEDNAKTIDHLTTTVEGEFVVDGVSHVIKKSLSQKWTKRRGVKEEVLTGTESEFFIDNVPLKAGEFQTQIASMFCPQDNLRLLSSIKAFGQLDMKEKRSKLIQMAGQMPELINERDYPRLSKYYETTKNVDAIKKQLKYEMDKLKAKQLEIPVKITENERNRPTGIDFDSLRVLVAEKQKEVETIDAKLQKSASSSEGLFAEMNALNSELQKTMAELTEIEQSLSSQRSKRLAEANDNVAKCKEKVMATESKIAVINRDLSDLESRISRGEQRKQELAKQWSEKNKETFPDTIDTVCPTCHRPYDAEDIQRARNEAVIAFNKGKTGVLSAIASEGNALVAQLSELKEEKSRKAHEIESLSESLQNERTKLSMEKFNLEQVPTLEFLKENSKEYQTVDAKRHELKTRIMDATPTEPEEERSLKNRKELLRGEITELTLKLAMEQNIEKVEERRKELEQEGKEIAQSIADVDAVLWEVATYQKAYIEVVEKTVSSMFEMVTWKMYQKNISNDGETEICECLVDGVPVSTNVNTANVINAGIDIVNALSKWLDVSFPLWIDGKESVTDLIDSDCQIITLEVKENSELSLR